MADLSLQAVSFTYPGCSAPAIDRLSMTLKSGEFVTLFGLSGSGKSTLLRLCKPALAPRGEQRGRILWDGSAILETEGGATVGFVGQRAAEQVVTDRVWHELAFGLENAGVPQEEIRSRVAETALFFGIQHWFDRDTSQLSGGELQLLNLASVMVMRPHVLLLDEPTAQLDPIGAERFLDAVWKMNRELGISVLLSEHRLESVFPASDRVIALSKGRIIYEGSPEGTGILREDPLFWSLPAGVQAAASVGEELAPLTVREGKTWLAGRWKMPVLRRQRAVGGDPVLQAKGLWFRYDRQAPDVIRDMHVELRKGEILSILGGNGAGKTTVLSLLAGVRKPDRGSVVHQGKAVLLPQDPQSLFLRQTVEEELEEMNRDTEKIRILKEQFALTGLERRNPFDLSGGEQQRLALAKAMLAEPDLLLLDEPTKGMDGYTKQLFARHLLACRKAGMGILLVSHDVEFCALVSDRCGLFFDGGVVSVQPTDKFFTVQSFYTTAAARMAREQGAVLTEELIDAIGGQLPPLPEPVTVPAPAMKEIASLPEKKSSFGWNKTVRWICLILLIGLLAVQQWIGSLGILGGGMMALCLAGALWKRPQKTESWVETERSVKGVDWFLGGAFLCLTLGTVAIGMLLLHDRKYYFISLLLLLETLVYFYVGWERGKPGARELAAVAALTALAVAGRVVFFALPQIKPMMAIVILTGLAFGEGTGFLVGAAAAFVSNMFFGQGAWTPWHMVAFGLVGGLSGLIAPYWKVNRWYVSLFGFFVTLLLYGFLMNLASLLLWQPHPTGVMLAATVAQGLPFDLVHAGGTAFFLWLLTPSWMEQAERMRVKYGLFQ